MQDNHHAILPPVITRADTTVASADPLVNAAYKWAIQQSATAVAVAAKKGDHITAPATNVNYLDFDEGILEQMARLGWNRSRGVAKMVPLACALYDHWKAQ